MFHKCRLSQCMSFRERSPVSTVKSIQITRLGRTASLARGTLLLNTTRTLSRIVAYRMSRYVTVAPENFLRHICSTSVENVSMKSNQSSAGQTTRSTSLRTLKTCARASPDEEMIKVYSNFLWWRLYSDSISWQKLGMGAQYREQVIKRIQGRL